MLRYAGGAPVLANPNRVQLERHRSGAARWPSASSRTFRLDGAGLQKPLRDGDVLTLLRDLAAVRQRGDAEGPRGPAAALSVHAGHAHPRPDPRSRRAHLARLLSAQEPAGADDRGRRAALARATRRPRGGDCRRPAAAIRCTATTAATAAAAATRAATGRCAAPIGAMPGHARARRLGPADRSRRGATERRQRQPASDRSRSTRRATVPSSPAAAPHRRAVRGAELGLRGDRAARHADLSTQVIPSTSARRSCRATRRTTSRSMPGDVVTVYSQKDVRVPVVAPDAPGLRSRARSIRRASTSCSPARRCSSLLARAGGFTPQAYVYGLEFSREETRAAPAREPRRRDRRLEALSAVQTARDAANRRDDASAQAPGGQQRRHPGPAAPPARIQPNGRIALELTPGRSARRRVARPAARARRPHHACRRARAS